MYRYLRPAKRGYYLVDDKIVYCDSESESKFLNRLVREGFSGKWRRLRGGLAYGLAHYSPDAELCILHDSMNRRALVEYKPNHVSEFDIRSRRRMLAASRYYRDAPCFLYVEKGRQWHLIEPGGKLSRTAQPTPGGIPITDLPKPRISIPIYNIYGRRYYTRPSTLIMKKTADGLELIVKSFFYSPKSRRRRHK